MNKFVIVCSLLLGITYAYNFDDAFYNQALAKEYDQLLEDSAVLPSHPRVRRDDEAGKCRHHHHFKTCCGDDLFESLHEKYRDTMKECFKQVTGKEFHHGPPPDPFSCDDIEKRKKDMICVKQCVGQKKGIVDSDGNIKEDDVRKFAKEFLTLDWLKPKVDGIVTKCLAEAKEAAEKRDSNDKDACNPSELKFSHCVFREIQLSCPADQIKDQEKCDGIREYVKKNDFFAPPHHHRR